MKTLVTVFIFFGCSIIVNAQSLKNSPCFAKTIQVVNNNITQTYNVFYNADGNIAAFTNVEKNDIVFEYETKQNAKFINKVSFYEAGNLVRLITRVLNTNGSVAQETMEEVLSFKNKSNQQYGIRNIQKFTYTKNKITKVLLDEYSDLYSPKGFSTQPELVLYTTHPDKDKGASYLLQAATNTELANNVTVTESFDDNVFLAPENAAFTFLLGDAFGAINKNVLNRSYVLFNNKYINKIEMGSDYKIDIKTEQVINCKKNNLSAIKINKLAYKTTSDYTVTINYDCTKNCMPNKFKPMLKPTAYNPPVINNQKETTIANTNTLPNTRPAIFDKISVFQNQEVQTISNVTDLGIRKPKPLCCDLLKVSFGNNVSGIGNFTECNDRFAEGYYGYYILFPSGKSVYKIVAKEGIEYRFHGYNFFQDKKITNAVMMEYTDNNLSRSQFSKEHYVTFTDGKPTAIRTFKYFYPNKYELNPDSCISYDNDNETVYSRIKYTRKKGNVISASLYNSTTKQEIEYTISVDKNKSSRYHSSIPFNYYLGIMDVNNPNLLLTVFARTGDAITDITPINAPNEKAIKFYYGYIKNNASFLTSMVGSNGIKNTYEYTCNYSKPQANVPPPPPVKGDTPTDINTNSADTIVTPIKPNINTTEVFDVPKTRQETLNKIYGKWLLKDGISITIKRDCDNDGIFEEVNETKEIPCKADEIIDYLSNGTWVKTGNTIKCVPTAPDKIDEGTWGLSNDGKTFKIKLGFITLFNLVIEKLTNTEMVLSKTLTAVSNGKPNSSCTEKTLYSYKRF
jgi:hypothetical protein